MLSCMLVSAWKRAIIKPIPKKSTSDPRLPLQYKGTALLSTVYILYTSVLNNRLVKYLEENGLYAEEQNSFRHTINHTLLLRNRKS